MPGQHIACGRGLEYADRASGQCAQFSDMVCPPVGAEPCVYVRDWVYLRGGVRHRQGCEPMGVEAPP